MKRKLAAITYTLFLIVINLLLPFAYDWYIEKLGWQHFPVFLIILAFLLFTMQIILAVYLWARVLDKTLD